MGRNRRPYMNEDAIERTAKVVKAFEGGGRDQPPIRFRQPGGDDGDPVRLGKTTAAWAKGTLADIELYEEGTPPSETANSPTETLEDCVNKFADIGADKWVIVARGGNGSWYLIAAECSADDTPA
jgi:hypothetical protein